MSQPMEALAKASELREERAAQREELRDTPPNVLIPALIDPPEALASYRLRELFGQRQNLIRRFSGPALERTLEQLTFDNPEARHWHTEIRLRELSKKERRRLAAALLANAPKTWSQS